MANSTLAKLGPWSGVYKPGYQIIAYSNGDPTAPIRGVDWRSVVSISTSKNLTSVSGTFTITLKHALARTHVSPMDVIVIRLRGHNQGWSTVFKGVVDDVGPDEQASAQGAQQNTVITGRCMGKYLQVNSMFLPVWDPQANLPTALTFGTGDASSKLGTNIKASTPRQIFGYIFDHFVIGLRNRVGLSGTPNARFWLNRTNRFEWIGATNKQPFRIPFVQFDEDTCDTALTRLEIQGFSEAWVDETGNIVYRRPGWDLPASWVLHSSGLIADTLQTSDVGLAGYVEVFPGAFPGVSSGQAQAMLAGRAPIPSDYVTGLQKAGFKSVASKEFIIDVDSKGQPTKQGQQNWYYQHQRKYGVRPYQITSPLLATREDAQAQAEGLLRQLFRLQKSGTVTIPGEPGVRLGQTLQLVGSLRGQKISRSFYIEGIAQNYVENEQYTTTLTLTHGRDPWDPHWIDVALPQFSAQQLANETGLLTPATPSRHDASLTTGAPGSVPAQGGFANPFDSWTPGRLDAGYDGTFGNAIYAPFSGTITYVSTAPSDIPGFGNNWGTWLQIEADHDIGLPQRSLYFSENLIPIVSSGQKVQAGEQIARGGLPAYHPQDSNPSQIEWGVATDGTVGTPYAATLGNGTAATQMVLNFNQWVNTYLGVASTSDTGNAGRF